MTSSAEVPVVSSLGPSAVRCDTENAVLESGLAKEIFCRSDGERTKGETSVADAIPVTCDIVRPLPVNGVAVIERRSYQAPEPIGSCCSSSAASGRRLGPGFIRAISTGSQMDRLKFRCGRISGLKSQRQDRTYLDNIDHLLRFILSALVDQGLDLLLRQGIFCEGTCRFACGVWKEGEKPPAQDPECAVSWAECGVKESEKTASPGPRMHSILGGGTVGTEERGICMAAMVPAVPSLGGGCAMALS